jgi:glycosyltransferase involved in cell wall biosynthesis
MRRHGAQHVTAGGRRPVVLTAVHGARAIARRLARGASAPAPLQPVAPEALLEVLREGPAPLVPRGPSDAPLHVAVVVPPFRRGSGGHSTIANLLRGLEARGHRCSVFVDDEEGRHAGQDGPAVDALFKEFFGPLAGTVHLGFGAWSGADVAMATGWQTVHRVLRLPGAAARAYLVQDHEPEFYGTSAERTWAEETYRLGLHCVCASPWLAEVVRGRYGASATPFDLGVDHDAYHPLPGIARRDDLVVAYARAVTPRRAVPLVLLALEELHRRRPDVEIALFGEAAPIQARFPHVHAGVLAKPQLAELYASATAGVVLSLTNPSLVPTEMLACGLPVVDTASDAMVATFGADGPVELAAFDPLGIASAIERLLDDAALRDRRARAGLDLVAGRTWPAAAAQVEAGLRAALAAAH